MDDNFKWCEYEWLTHERWGHIHPGKTECWYDPGAVSIDDHEYLHLKTRKNPNIFTLSKSDPNGYTEVESPVGIGLVSCTEKFGYGLFKIEAKLPDGPYMWPAFWLWSFSSWPPEIDVFEGYSGKRGSYFNWNMDLLIGNLWKTPSNIHLGKEPDNYSIGAKRHKGLGLTSPSKKFNKYTLLWKEDNISIFFNGILVRFIDDKHIMEQFKGHKMNVVINNGIQKDHIKTEMNETDMIVKYFEYIPMY
jgi:hypothetical protein